MGRMNVGLSRRSFLAGAAALATTGVVGLAGCSPEGSGTTESATAASGGDTTVYTGRSEGRNGEIVVNVGVAGNTITSVSVVSENESKLIATTALTLIPELIVANQSLDVDTVSGATLTSFGIKGAVKDALNQAGLSTGDLANTGGFTATTPELPINADVAIIGAGLSGLTCAARLLQNGKSVAIFEETGHVGGSAAVAYGWLTGAGTLAEAAEGTEDSPDLYYKHIEDLAESLWEGEVEYPEMARKYADNTGAAFDWLDTYAQVDFGTREGTYGIYDPEDVRRIYGIYGNAKTMVYRVFNLVAEGISAGTASLSLNSHVTSIIQDAEGTVTGIQVTTPDGATTDYNFDTVVLCTGGYSHNVEMLKEYNYTNCGTFTPSTGDGHGFPIAIAAGAQMVCMETMGTYGGGVPDTEGELSKQMNISMPNQVWVDASGKRMTCEDGSYQSERMWETAQDNIVYTVFSDALRGVVSPISSFTAYLEGFVGPTEGWNTFDEMIEAGEVAWSAESAEELAEKMGVDASAFAETIDAYNAGCESGEDEFGRVDPMKLEGTLYGVKTVPFMCMSTGGIKANPQAQVVNASDEPIPGLYIAGEQLGLQQYCAYTRAGCGLGGAVSWGYIAANSICEA